MSLPYHCHLRAFLHIEGMGHQWPMLISSDTVHAVQFAGVICPAIAHKYSQVLPMAQVASTSLYIQGSLPPVSHPVCQLEFQRTAKL